MGETTMKAQILSKETNSFGDLTVTVMLADGTMQRWIYQEGSHSDLKHDLKEIGL